MYTTSRVSSGQGLTDGVLLIDGDVEGDVPIEALAVGDTPDDGEFEAVCDVVAEYGAESVPDGDTDADPDCVGVCDPDVEGV